MKNLRYISVFLLVFIGLNALAGGYLLIDDPSGGLLNINILQVGSSLFDDFLIPGVLLFLFVGVLSVVATFFVLYQWKGFASLVLLQGVILSVWITAQIFLFEQIHLVQYVIAAIGLGLFVCGMRMRQLLARRKHISEKP